MKRGIKAVACVIGGALSVTGLALVARGAAEDSPYHAIVERNVFDLKPPPPPPAAPTVTNAPPPNVKLTGITSMLGVKRAFFMVAAAAQPGKPPGKEESFIIEEGQRQGVIEVVEINQKAATVKIRNDGNESTLTLDTSPKLPSGPGGGGGPPGAPNPGAPRLPGNFAAPQNAANNGYNARPTGAGVGRSPIPLPDPSQSQYNQYGGANNGLSSLPARTLRTGGNAIDPMQMLQQTSMQQPTQPTPQEPEMSLEQKIILTEINRQQTQSAVEQGQMPPIPPLEFPGSKGQNENGAATTPAFPTVPGRR